jgi:transposase
MIEALIAGERDPEVLAGLARGRMKAKRAALIEALTGRFDDHHAELARMLLDQIDQLTAQIGKLTTRIGELIAAIPAAQGVDADGVTGPGAGTGPDAARPDAITRLDEVPGISAHGAQVILAEIGLDMSRFPTAGHLVSWAKLCPRTIQSGAKNRSGKAGKGNPYLKGVLGEIATAAAKTGTFLGERYRRIVKRRGKLKALVAVARTILVIIWHLLANPATRFYDLGAGYYETRIDKGRKMRNHVRQLEALGYAVTLAPAA